MICCPDSRCPGSSCFSNSIVERVVSVASVLSALTCFISSLLTSLLCSFFLFSLLHLRCQPAFALFLFYIFCHTSLLHPLSLSTACQEAYIKLLEQEACSTGCASQPSEPEIKRRKVRKSTLRSIDAPRHTQLIGVGLNLACVSTLKTQVRTEAQETTLSAVLLFLLQLKAMTLRPKPPSVMEAVSSWCNDIVSSAQSFISSTWTFYLQADDGKVVVFQVGPAGTGRRELWATYSFDMLAGPVKLQFLSV